MNKESQRVSVIELFKSGMKTSDIVRTTGYSQRNVYNYVKRFKETGCVQDKPRSGRPTTVTTPEMVNKVRCRIKRNPEQSMRKMSRDLGIDEKSVRIITKDKLNLRSYKINKCHYLKDAMKENRLAKCRKMQRLVAGCRLNSVIFTDEKIFTIEPSHNRQNARQLLKKGQQKTMAAKIINRRLFPSSIMVWAGICASGKTPLLFIDRNIKINAVYYQENILRDTLHPWAMQHFDGSTFTLQQDWAPAHSAKSTIDVCKKLFPGFWSKDVWPSNSPDLNPMDYSVWSILEQNLSRKRYHSLEGLKVALVESWEQITNEQCATIISHFRKRLRKCIESRGGNFEHML